MKIEDAKIGMRVRISSGECRATDDFCGLNNEMIRIRGSLTTIRHINADGGIRTTAGWSWHPKDLMPVSQDIHKKKRKKIKPVLFDEELLWTE